MESRLLEAFMITLPEMKRLFGLDAQICLCDREKTIGVWYGDTFRLQIDVGETFDENKPGHGPMLEVLRTGKGSSGRLPEYVYGVPVEGILSPIMENGAVVGVISVAVSVAGQTAVADSAVQLNENLEKIRDVSEGIAHSAMELAERIERMQGLTGEIGRMAEETGSASSEAIVRRLAIIQDALTKIGGEVRKTLEISTVQAGAVEEITGMLSNITREAENLMEQALKQ